MTDDGEKFIFCRVKLLQFSVLQDDLFIRGLQHEI